MKKIGILGMQGAIEEHREKLRKLAGIEPVIVKTKEKIAEVDGLILPGGESTAMGRLLNYFNLTEPLKQSIEAGLPVWGTCAGMILLAKNIEDQDERYLSTMDITVKRNAYGSQLDSFSCEKEIPEISKDLLPLVFIRAPYITKLGQKAQAVATVDGNVVCAKQDNMLVSSFHPELTDDASFHEYFAEKFV